MVDALWALTVSEALGWRLFDVVAYAPAARAASIVEMSADGVNDLFTAAKTLSSSGQEAC